MYELEVSEIKNKVTNKIMENKKILDFMGTIGFVFMVVFLIIFGYFIGKDSPETKSIYTEREKCNSLGGYYRAVDTDIIGEKEFLVSCKVPEKVIEM